jgi:hypothetical protein
MTDDTATRRSRSLAERMRLLRKRRKYRRLAVQVEADEHELDLLVARGYLAGGDRAGRSEDYSLGFARENPDGFPLLRFDTVFNCEAVQFSIVEHLHERPMW